MKFKNFKKFIFNKKRVITFVAVLLLVVLSSGYFFFFHSQPVEAAWWNDSWAYRKSIAVTNNTTEETNVYVAVTIDTSDTTRFKTNCGDLRFTKTNGELLPYLIVSGCGTASTVVNVNFDVFPAGDQTIYYYYGNPNAADGFSAADFTTVASNYTVGSLGAEEKGAGPVAYWAFDEGQGTAANDGTSSRNNGTLTNMSSTASSTSGWQTEDSCISGKCLAFDGGNDRVSTSKNVGISSTTATVSLWFKTPPVSDYATKVIMELSVNSNINDAFAIAFNDNSGGAVPTMGGFIATMHSAAGYSLVATNNRFDDGTWHHLEVVFDRTQATAAAQTTIYVDGKTQATSFVGSYDEIHTTTFADNPIYIGHRGTAAYFVKGLMDEVKVYNYARSAAQIKMDYNVGLAGQGGSGSGNEGTAVSAGGRSQKWMSDGLVGWWKMDEAVGTWNGTAGEVQDWSGNGNNGTAAGNASTTAGKFGNGGIFDGTGDYVDFGNSNSFDFGTNDFSISAWVKANNFDNGFGFVTKSDSTAGSSNGLKLFGFPYAGSNYFQIKIGNGTSFVSANSALGDVTTGIWYHIVGVRLGNDLKFYLNGNLKGSGSGASAIVVNSSSYNLQIGNSQGEYFPGSIDETRIYNRALSDREVRDLYNFAPGPVGWWKMEEGSGTALYDTSGNGNNSNFAGGPTWSAGKFGKGIKLDGVDDYSTVNHSSALNPGAANFTVSTWLKWNGSGRGGVVKNNGDTSCVGCGAYSGWGLINNNNGTPAFLIGTSNSNYRSAIGASSVPIGQWVYLTGAWDTSTQTAYIYQNGVLIASNSSSGGTVGDVNFSYNMNFGSLSTDNYGAGNLDNAVFDDVKIYNYARTPKQIVEDMNAGHPAGGSPVGSQAGYWKFDEGYGSVAYDSSPNKLNGIIYGTATSTLNGKFNKALTFDGVNDYVDLGNSTNLDIGTGDYSVTFWIKRAVTGTGASQILLNNGATNASQQGYIVGLTGADKLYVYVMDGSGSYVINDLLSASSVGTNWTHVVWVLQRNGYSMFYINGKQDGTPVAISNTANISHVSGLKVGTYNLGSNYYNGLMDELKIYNYALTSDEVKVDYNKGASLKLGGYSQSSTGVASSSAASLYCVPGSTDPCSPPVGEWKFEEGSGGTANDSSGNSNTGTWSGTGSHWTTGKVGKAGKFNGTDDYVQTGSDFVNTSAVTVCAWAYAKSYGANTFGRIFDNGKMLIYIAGQAYLAISSDAGNTQKFSGTGSLILKKWQYWCATRDASGIANIYLDGSLSGTANQTSGTPASGTTNVSLGGKAFVSPNSRTWDGSIDDIRIYNYVRTPSQIAWDYNNGKPVGWWKFDEGQGGIAHDASGNNNNGTIYPGTGGTQTATSTMWTNGASGKRNGSLNFDGADDWVNLGRPSNLQIMGDVTMSLWLKAASYSGAQDTLFGWAGGSSDAEAYNHLYLFSVNGIGDINYHHEYGAGVNQTNTFDTNLSKNVWYNTIVVRDTTAKTVKLYIDGKYFGVYNYSSDPTGGSSADLRIGGLYGTSYNFDGQIDDVRVYNYALTAAQVRDVYGQGAVRFGQ
ncbi:MAG: DUF2341 domain-containing protein [bacterium]|nr:DUF2341 domain-containing protein [bacterium]